MASNIVQVSRSEADAGAKKLQANLDEAKRMLEEMRKIVQQTGDWWQGDAERAFVESFDSGVTVFNQQLQKLQSHANNMVQSVSVMNDADANISRQIRKY